ncbi:MAG: shikimate kinase [Streptococcaceae bacterium]|jgi:shikimate kinase|nr:shikimate kinase [Streptococcaceae bacterium]
MKNIILIGFMGAGKTTVGQELSQLTGLALINLDDEIIKKIKMPIHQFFKEYGEEAFRVIEEELLEKFSHQPIILATGGGVVVRLNNRMILQKGQTVLLDASIKTLIQRIREDKTTIRPLAVNSSDEEITQLFETRKMFYQQSARLIVKTDDKNAQEVASEIIKNLKDNFENLPQ